MQEVLPRLMIDRGEGERVVIGDPLNPLGFVEVVKIHGTKRVRMSFMFNKDVKINREELVHSILHYAEDINSKMK